MKDNTIDIYKEKNVLVAGGTGTLGIPLVKKLIHSGANVEVVSVDSAEYAKQVFGDEVIFNQYDLTVLENCLTVTEGKDYVFNLVGITGSTGIGETKVASYFYPQILYQTYLMEAAFRNKISRYLFVSSINVYPESSGAKKENEMWNGIPKQNDRFPALAKRIGEIQAETYLKEHGWDAVRIVRPSNVYGPYVDFDPATAQVIPALISRMLEGENPVSIWGDGTAVRDFIYSEECAHWMMVALDKAPPCTAINLGSGIPYTIKDVAETIADCVQNTPNLSWDITKPTGDPMRLLDMEMAEEILGYEQLTPLKVGIEKTIDWYVNNRELAINKGARYHDREN